MEEGERFQSRAAITGVIMTVTLVTLVRRTGYSTLSQWLSPCLADKLYILFNRLLIDECSAPSTFIKFDEEKWIAVPSFDRVRQNLSKLVSNLKINYFVDFFLLRNYLSVLHLHFDRERFLKRTLIAHGSRLSRSNGDRCFFSLSGNTRDYAWNGLVIICRIERYLLATCHAPGLWTKTHWN